MEQLAALLILVGNLVGDYTFMATGACASSNDTGFAWIIVVASSCFLNVEATC